jgi:hypothetical protein
MPKNSPTKLRISISLLLLCAAALFGSPSSSAFAPVTGHWWNPNESGRGYNIDVYNGVLVITVYTYKANGDSEWYLASGFMSPDQRQFTGTLDKYRNGQCISCSYSGRPALVGNDGIISINFLSETVATLSLPGGRTTIIQPFFPPAATTSLNGTYRLKRGTVDYLGGPLLDTDAGNLIASGTMVVSGNQITQSFQVTLNGAQVSIGYSGTFVDYGAYIVATLNGHQTRAAVITRNGSTVATESINPAIGTNPPYAEVDQWELVSSATVSALSERAASNEPADVLGFAIGTALARMATKR